MAAEPVEVNIDITSDIVCPWCWVGKRHLDVALDRVKDQYKVNIRWFPFILNPWVPEDGMNFKDYAIAKFGEDGLKRFTSGAVPFFEQGKAVGLNFNYRDDTRVVPTKKAHILLDFAFKHDKQHKLHEKLFGAYFCDGADISNNEVLSDLVQSVGLDPLEALKTLDDQEYIDRYKEEIKAAQQKGITGVPFFELYLANSPQNIRQTFSGAQPPETIIAVLNRLKMLSKF